MQVAWKMYEALGFIRYPEIDFQQGSFDVFGFQNYYLALSLMGLPNQISTRTTQFRLSRTFGAGGDEATPSRRGKVNAAIAAKKPVDLPMVARPSLASRHPAVHPRRPAMSNDTIQSQPATAACACCACGDACRCAQCTCCQCKACDCSAD